MDFHTFALASREFVDLSTEDLTRNAEIAAWFSDGLRKITETWPGLAFCGVGLFRQNWVLHPTILIDVSILKIDVPTEQLTPVVDTLGLEEFLRGAFGEIPTTHIKALHVLPVEESFLHTAPGEEIFASIPGSVGPFVQWDGVNQGFLTAGHVAQTPGTWVKDIHGQTIGVTVWTNDPALAPHPVGDVDVAVVALHQSTNHPAQSLVVPGAGHSLTVCANGQSSEIYAFLDPVKLGNAQAWYAKCYATEEKITTNGDSGSTVMSGNHIAGMVIGGFNQRDMSIVQSTEYQLSEIRQRSNLMVSI